MKVKSQCTVDSMWCIYKMMEVLSYARVEQKNGSIETGVCYVQTFG